MSNNFKIGDRVALYTAQGRFTGTVKLNPGFVYVVVECDRDSDGFTFEKRVHPKQCRRLVQKRRRIRIHKSLLDGWLAAPRRDINTDTEDYIEFVEVKRRKK
jgi:hypothetical protein